MESKKDGSSSEPILRDNQLFKSISTREPSFREFHFSPPRSSSSAIPSLFSTNSSHRCISSLLTKDGRILSIATLGRCVYTGSDANVVRVWKLPQFTECQRLRSNSGTTVSALALSESRIFAAYDDSKIRVWRRLWEGDASVPQHVRESTMPKLSDSIRSYMPGKDRKMKQIGRITSLAIKVGDDLLYSASLDGRVKVWRISSLRCIETLQAHPQPVNAVIVGEDGMLYTASDDASIRVWRSNLGSSDKQHRLATTLPTRSSPVKTLALTNDSAYLYGGCSDGYIHCWLRGWLSGHFQYSGPLQGHNHAVTSLATVAVYVASGSADSTCRVWLRQRDGQHVCLAVLDGHMAPIRCVAAFLSSVAGGDEDGCMVCTGSVDGMLKLWHVESSGNEHDQSKLGSFSAR